MVEKWHISNGEPKVCTAQEGKCPLGGVTGRENHYGSKEEAYAAIERDVAKEKSLRAKILRKGLKSRTPEDIYDDLGIKMRRHVKDAAGVSSESANKLYDDDLKNGTPVDRGVIIDNLPFKINAMRISKKAAVILDNTAQYDAMDRMEELYDRAPGVGIAVGRKSLDNINADCDVLAAEIRERVATGMVMGHATVADKFYTFDVHALDGRAVKNHPETYHAAHNTTYGAIDMRQKTGLYVDNAIMVNEESLRAAMEEAGYDYSEVQTTSESLQMTKVRSFVEGVANDELGLRPRGKGTKEARADFVNNSGLFETHVTYEPDPTSVNAISDENPDAVAPRMFNEDNVKGLTNAQLRIAFVQAKTTREELTDTVNSMQKSMFRDAGVNVKTIAEATGKDASASVNGLTFRKREQKRLTDDKAKIEQFVTSHGGDMSEMMSRRTTVTMDSLKAFHRSHPDISVYNNVKLQSRVVYRDLGRADEGNPKVDKILDFMA